MAARQKASTSRADRHLLTFTSRFGNQSSDSGRSPTWHVIVTLLHLFGPERRVTKQSSDLHGTGNSYYASTSGLSVDHYQLLVDRGWRRSGTLLYKPDLRHSCCPHYAIRLPAVDFKPRKDQKSAVHRWNRFVLGDEYIKEAAKRYPLSKEEKARQRKEFDLMSAVHESESTNVKRPPAPEHRFEVTLEPDEFTQEKYKLFENYQTHVHNEPPPQTTRGGFRRFLCDSPLQRISRRLSSGVQQQLGSFHQCYRLDGRLIAMGVLDLMPHCVSGVYFIYHQDFEKWSFGKLSALREIALAVENEYEYYYMGYYIHSCAKMKYKNDYRPQHVLDLETFTWDPLNDEVKTAMDGLKYVSVSRLRQSKNASLESVMDEGTKDGEKTSTARKKTFDSPIEACDAVDDGLSLFELDFPGMMPAQDVEKQVDLDLIKLRLDGGQIVPCDMLVAWDSKTILDHTSIKGIIAELAACVGPEVAKEIIIDLSGP